MRNAFILRICFLITLLLYMSSVCALPPEEVTIKGKVIDEALKEAVPGVNVAVKGTSTGIITDYDGNYSIVVPNKQAVLVFSFMGYATQEIAVGSKRIINVSLKEDSQVLGEVEIVAIAYGNQDKKMLTSAVSSIDNKELIKSPVASVTNVLAGSLPGVSSIQTTGQPGKDAASIFIRGSGSLNDAMSKPLILVDGVERDFAQIDPNEIESISVLKDASSTAVFGVRGANGVVLVTTRRGRTGKAQVSVSTSLGLQQPISLVEQTGSYEYARFWNMKQQMDHVANPKLYFTPEQVEAYRTGSDPIMYPSVNWRDYIFNNVYLQSKNNVNISGGSDNVQYFISVGYTYQNGLLKELPGQRYDNNYRYNRYNYRANIDAKLTKTTQMKLGVGGVLGKIQEPRSAVTGLDHDQNPWVIAQIWSVPFSGPGFLNGVRTQVPQSLVPVGQTEPLRDGMSVFYGYGYNQTYDTTLNMDLDLTQKLDFVTKGLSVSLKGAYDNQFKLEKVRAGGGVETQTVYYKSLLDDSNALQTDPDFDKSYVYLPVGSDTPLSYSEGNYKRAQNWYIEGRVNYDRTFGDHKVSGLFLYNQSRNYYPEQYTYIPRSYVGLVGRATYAYQSKYLVDFNIGYNGSENFAPGSTRFGVFPSVSAGWIVSAEKFMEKQKVVDYLKLRASWGRVGNDKGADNSRFMYMPAVWSDSGSYSFGANSINNQTYAGISAMGNPLVTWETADKQNYGIDTKFFDNRLTFSFDYFTEKRQGILISPKSTPSIIATSLPNLNIGKVDNHGYEITLGWNDRIGKNFNYYIDANMSFARNKIINMDEVPKQFAYMNETGGSTGRQLNVYQFMRLYQYSDFVEGANGSLTLKPELPQPYQKVYPGDAMYADLNGDMIVDGNDKEVAGYATRPEYTFGMNMGFNWKGFNFSMQWVGSRNVSRMYDIEYRIPFTNAGTRGLLTYFYDGCWTEENQQNALYPRASENSESWNSEDSSLWLIDASYLRLKSMSVGYTLTGNKFLKKLGISSMGLTFSGYNLLTFSPLKYLDPESDPDRFGDYPLVKLYSFGLNLNF